MTKLRFYSGLREIGGTVVAVETENTACFFDFGFSYADRIDDKVCLREKKEAFDYVNLGVLNAIDGIYEPDTAKKLGLKAYGETDKEIFFIISHMHIDHMGGLGCLDRKVPVYMSADSAKLYHEMGIMGELEVREHENVIPVDYDSSFTVGDIKVTCIQVDHDVIGACGFLIETNEGKICYTGDYRYHGFHPEISAAFADKCKGADVMISEGVTISFADVDMLSLEGPVRERTELTLLEDMKSVSASEEGLIVINNYNRNVERIHRLIGVIKDSGRVMALEPEQADYIASFYPEDEFCVYIPEATENICGEDAAKKLSDERLLAPGLNDRRIVNRSDLKASPAKYILQQDYRHIYELFDLKDVLSLYVHMDGAPLGDYDPSYAKYCSLLDNLGIHYEHWGLGGHAEPYYLRHTVDTVKPGILVPLHSFRPEQLVSEHAGKIILPKVGDIIEL